MDWAFVMSVVCTGILVVFIALIVLIIIVQATGKLFETLDKSKKNKTQTTQAPKQAPAVVAAPVAAPAAPAATNTDGISDEVVAAISAAISCVMMESGNNKPFVIKSIKRSTAGRNSWNMAGIADNTRPF